MKRFRSYLLIIGMLCLGLFTAPQIVTHAFTTNPTPTKQYVVDDYAHILNNKTKQQVVKQDKSYQHDTSTHPRIVMMTVPDTNNDSIDDYARKMLSHQRWHIGSKRYGNWVLILFAKNNGKNNVRISNGLGTQHFISDSKSLKILKSHENSLKSSNPKQINAGLQQTFLNMSGLMTKDYGHLSKAKARKIMAKGEKKHQNLINGVWIGLAKLAVLPVGLILIAILYFHFHNDNGDDGTNYYNSRANQYYMHHDHTLTGNSFGGFSGDGSSSTGGGANI